ncbi:response regulator transcription factor [Rubrivivax sp. RP6-9]|uniref:response regulator transcription factor n=1 Tax=Rubrivivax sp. RP6-9 TaxID=3415750 RepID=UPI003CC6927C
MVENERAQYLQILVADDHAVVREGLKRLLESAAGSWVVTEAGSGFEALDLLRRHRFDIAVFDLSMPGMSGLDLLARVRVQYPALPVLILTMRAEETYARRAFEAGARGYITKDTAAQELVGAVRKVAAGGVYVSVSLADRMVLQLQAGHRLDSLDKLSDRELDVLRRLVAGQRPTEIAQALSLSIKTVSSHKSRIQDKLQLPTLAALVRFGLEQGLGEDDAQPLDGA